MGGGSSSQTTHQNGTEPECYLFPENPNHCTVIINVRRVFASISLVGCVFMIFVIWLFRKYVAFSQRLILYLTIAALNSCITYLMGELHPDGPLCEFQAFWLSFSDWAVLLWVSCITMNLYFNVIKGRTTERLEWAYHIGCWGVSLLMSCLPFIGDHYGPAGAWCWIVDNWRWRVGIWYGPLFVILITLVVVYTYISYALSRKVTAWEGTYDPDTERQKQLLKEDIKPLRAYPFVYLAISLFPLINRIQNAVDSHNPVFALVLLASISSPLHGQYLSFNSFATRPGIHQTKYVLEISGAINAIVFGMDRETFQRLTPSQMKMAIQNRFSDRGIIREFPESSNYREHQDEEY